jgi:hypothetical protein
MKSLLTLISFIVLVNISFAQESPRDTMSFEKKNLSTAVIGVEGMACQEGCADKISSNLEDAYGVVSAVVSYEKNTFFIRINLLYLSFFM